MTISDDRVSRVHAVNFLNIYSCDPALQNASLEPCEGSSSRIVFFQIFETLSTKTLIV